MVWLSGYVGALCGAVAGGRKRFFKGFQGFCGLCVKAGELGGDTGLDMDFKVFGAGAVAFGTGLEGVDEGLGEADGGLAERII